MATAMAESRSKAWWLALIAALNGSFSRNSVVTVMPMAARSEAMSSSSAASSASPDCTQSGKCSVSGGGVE